MKILAIRGRNLASLSAAFDVDFTTAPLAAAGLFAITGPTGSGKSTLLDALCLALYGDTPRLSGAGQSQLPDVAGETITSSDVRAILRRGAGEGFAEVDFVGGDGVPYRARWSVRRARGKGSGKLQKIEMSLLRIADERDIGGKLITEVKPMIEAKIGLRFAQFTRAVLLAQNEFAAFLKSGDNERAELLEMLTGSARFSDLSRRAYLRAKEETAKLDQLKTRLADQLPLSAADRSTLEAELATAERAVAALDQRRLTLEASLRWHDGLAKAIAAAQQAEDEVARATAQREAAAAARSHLALIEAVQPARALLEDDRRIAAESTSAANAIGEAHQGLAAAADTVRRAEAARDDGKQALEKATQARQAAAPQLAQARTLAAQIASLEPGHAESRQALAACAQALHSAQQAVQKKQDEIVQVGKEHRNLDIWLADHAALQPLAAQWPRWDTLLKQAEVASGDLAGIAATLKSLIKRESTATRTLQTAEAARAHATAAAQATELALKNAAADLAGFDQAALLAQRNCWEEQRDRIASATTCWNRCLDLAERQQAVTSRLSAAEQEAADNAGALAQANTEHPAATLTLAHAERALQLAQAASAKNVEALRAKLEADVPCPVCGGREHPWATQDPGLHAALAALEADRAQARKTLDAIAGRITAAETQGKLLEKSRFEAAQELAGLTESGTAAQAEWATHPLAATAPAPAAERKAWLADLDTLNRDALTALATQEKSWHAAQTRRDAAQLAANAAQQTLAAAVAALASAAQDQQTLRQACAHEQARQDEIGKRLNAGLADLDAAFADSSWRDGWRTFPAEFHASAREQSAAWTGNQQRSGSLSVQRQSLASDLEGRAAAVETAATHADRTRLRFKQIDGDMTQKTGELAAIFSGRPADAVEAALTGAVATAQQAFDAQQSALTTAQLAHAKATETLNQGQARARQLAAALASANDRLHAWLADFNTRPDRPALDAASLETLLAHEVAWINQERAAFHQLDLALTSANAVFANLCRTREAHRATRPCAEEADTLHDRLTATRAELAAANANMSAWAVKRAQDDARRDKYAAIADAIATQEAKTQTWSQLNEMIGSADGKKFRNIAQQLTLDVLLGYANHHLTTLARRYRLERIAETLDLMAIDRDMADEVRSVHSLSGGESFLVSLALALGLASLSSHRVKVESLFIDEGFGSLDADALRIAMDALDGLQAQGRKVGVISHVQEMTERIGTQIRIERLNGGNSRIVLAQP